MKPENKEITLPEGVIGSLAEQVWNYAESERKDRGRDEFTAYFIDGGGTPTAVVLEAEYRAEWEHAVCSTDRGDDRWTELAEVEAQVVPGSCGIYRYDDGEGDFLPTGERIANMGELKAALESIRL